MWKTENKLFWVFIWNLKRTHNFILLEIRQAIQESIVVTKEASESAK